MKWQFSSFDLGGLTNSKQGIERIGTLDLIASEQSPWWKEDLKNQFGWIWKEKLHWISIPIDLHSNLFPKVAFLEVGRYIHKKERINIRFSHSHDREPFLRSSKLLFLKIRTIHVQDVKIKSYFKAYSRKHQFPLLFLPVLCLCFSGFPGIYIINHIIFHYNLPLQTLRF